MKADLLKKAWDQIGLVQNIDYWIDVNKWTTWYRDDETQRKIFQILKK